MPILLKHNGETFQIDDADSKRIMELTIAAGGDIGKAVAQHFVEKFGKPMPALGDGPFIPTQKPVPKLGRLENHLGCK